MTVCHLHKIRVLKDPTCRACGDGRNSQHVLGGCLVLRSVRLISEIPESQNSGKFPHQQYIKVCRKHQALSTPDREGQSAYYLRYRARQQHPSEDNNNNP